MLRSVTRDTGTGVAWCTERHGAVMWSSTGEVATLVGGAATSQQEAVTMASAHELQRAVAASYSSEGDRGLLPEVCWGRGQDEGPPICSHLVLEDREGIFSPLTRACGRTWMM